VTGSHQRSPSDGRKARAATAYARIALGKDAETTTAIEAASEQVRMLALSDDTEETP
jgi:hypothetical protein